MLIALEQQEEKPRGARSAGPHLDRRRSAPIWIQSKEAAIKRPTALLSLSSVLTDACWFLLVYFFHGRCCAAVSCALDPPRLDLFSFAF